MSRARNVGASAARGTLLAFSDRDDLVSDSWVADAGSALRQHGCDDSEFSIRVLDARHQITRLTAWCSTSGTEGLRRTLRKVYLSGIAETVVWQRHPATFAGRPTLLGVLGDLVAWPASAVRQVAARTASPRSLARSAVTTWAHAVGYLTWTRPGRAGTARLVFEPYEV